MIEVVIDFNEIEKEYKNSNDELSHILILHISKKFGLPYKNRIGKWDAFADNFSEYFYPELPEDYKYDPNDEWGWSDYEDYLNYKSSDKEMGIKNEKGRRDDLRMILINFYPFYNNYSSIAQTFLEYTIGIYSERCVEKQFDDDDDCLKFEFCIKS